MWKKKQEEQNEKKSKEVYDVEQDEGSGITNAKSQNNDFDIQTANLNINTEDDEEEKAFSIKPFLVFLCILLFIAFISVATWSISSDMFLLKSITVSSGDKVDSASIREIFSGDMGRNLILFDTSIALKKIENMPYISNVRISKKFPDSLNVAFEERSEFAFVTTNSGDSYIVDREGYVLANAFSNDNSLPYITLALNNDYREGAAFSGTDLIRYNNLVYLLEAVKNAKIDYEINYLGYDDSEKIRFSLVNENLDILYGQLKKEQVNDKLLYLNAILKKAKEKNLKGYLDMSADNYYEKSVLSNEI